MMPVEERDAQAKKIMEVSRRTGKDWVPKLLLVKPWKTSSESLWLSKKQVEDTKVLMEGTDRRTASAFRRTAWDA